MLTNPHGELISSSASQKPATPSEKSVIHEYRGANTVAPCQFANPTRKLHSRRNRHLKLIATSEPSRGNHPYPLGINEAHSSLAGHCCPSLTENRHFVIRQIKYGLHTFSAVSLQETNTPALRERNQSLRKIAETIESKRENQMASWINTAPLFSFSDWQDHGFSEMGIAG